MAMFEHMLAQRASALAPTPSQLKAAARSHNYLRDILATGNMECRITNSYLSGSYARQTAVRPLDDVDVLFEIDPSHWRRDFFRRLLGQLPAPDVVLATFARALRYRYESMIRTQRRSVGVIMNHLRIDVVPAVVDEDNPNWLRIPDRSTNLWIVTAPRVHSNLAAGINESNAGRFKPFVRLVKGWNNGLPSTAHQKSFVVETLAAILFSNNPLNSLTEGAYQFFDFVSWLGGHRANLTWQDSFGVSFGGWSGVQLADLAGTGGNLLEGVDSASLQNFASAARVARDAITKASNARSVKTAWSYLDRRFMGGMSHL